MISIVLTRATQAWRPLMLVCGTICILLLVLSDLFEASDKAEYDKVMHTISKGTTEQVPDTNTLESNRERLDELQDRPNLTYAPKPGAMRIGFAEVEYALRLVDLDHFGQILLNAETEATLSRSVSRLPQDLSEEELSHAGKLIKMSFPDDAGDQIARIFTRYYHYKIREKILVSDMPAPNSASEALEQLQQISTIRSEMMGPENAEKLFGLQTKRAENRLNQALLEQGNHQSHKVYEKQRRTLDTLATGHDYSKTVHLENLSNMYSDVAALHDADRPEAEIQERMALDVGNDAANQLMKMDNQQQEWNERYQLFSQDKLLVIAASLSDDDQKQQIEELFRLHYSEEELPGARAYDRQASN